jgi:hypothetical protein
MLQILRTAKEVGDFAMITPWGALFRALGREKDIKKRADALAFLVPAASLTD